MIVISTIVGALAGMLGMYVSVWLDISSGATIVLLEAAAFLVTFVATGVLRRRRAGRIKPSPASPRSDLRTTWADRYAATCEMKVLAALIGMAKPMP